MNWWIGLFEWMSWAKTYNQQLRYLWMKWINEGAAHQSSNNHSSIQKKREKSLIWFMNQINIIPVIWADWWMKKILKFIERFDEWTSSEWPLAAAPTAPFNLISSTLFISSKRNEVLNEIDDWIGEEWPTKQKKWIQFSFNFFSFAKKWREWMNFFVVGPSAGTAAPINSRSWRRALRNWWAGLFPWAARPQQTSFLWIAHSQRAIQKEKKVLLMAGCIKSHPIHKLIPFHSSQLSSNSSCLSFMVEFISWDNF